MLFRLSQAIVLLLILLLGPGAAFARTADTSSSILILGDSLSSAYNIEIDRGWVRLLERRLRDEGYAVSLMNASITGETTRGGVNRLPALLEKHAPQVVVIELGSNDGLRGFPLAVLRKNLETMISLSQAAGARVVLAGNRLPPNYSEAYSDAFQAVFVEVAEATDSALIGFFLKDVATDDTLLQADRLHPNALAQPLLRDRVYDHVKPLLADSKL